MGKMLTFLLYVLKKLQDATSYEEKAWARTPNGL